MLHLADHIRPLLRDHDCVIIPDFGGLVAESVSAHLSAVRLHLGPPAKQVAFNQALTRNDGLLVDALSQYLKIPAAQAREVLRHAVADLHQDLRQSQRTELPGIGVFRQAPGRGLTFDYTGTDNLLSAAFGLPALSVRPVLATDARLAREKRPALLPPVPLRRPAAAQRRLRRVLKGFGIGLAASLLVSASYLLSLQAGLLPAARSAQLPPPPSGRSVAVSGAARAPEPQQAALAHNDWSSGSGAAAEAAARPGETGMAAAAPATEGRPAANAHRLVAAAAEPATKPPAISAPVVPPAAPAVAVAKWGAAAPARAKRPGAAVGQGAKARAPQSVAALGAKAAPAPARPPAAAPAALPAASAPAINRRLGRCYVVAGAFGRRADAEQCRARLAKAGFAGAKVVLRAPGGRYFRATVADYADLASARAAAARLRAQRRTFFDVYSY